MKHKRIITVITVVAWVLLLVLLLFAGFVMVARYWFTNIRTEFTDGFSPELLHTLATWNKIFIPEDAVFIKGFMNEGFRNNYIVILFDLPVDVNQIRSEDDTYNYIVQKLKLDRARYIPVGPDGELYNVDWYEEMGGKLKYRIKDKTREFSHISYTLCENKIRIRLAL